MSQKLSMSKEDKISASKWLNSADEVCTRGHGKRVTWPNIIKILEFNNIIVQEKPSSSSKVGYSNSIKGHIH